MRQFATLSAQMAPSINFFMKTLLAIFLICSQIALAGLPSSLETKFFGRDRKARFEFKGHWSVVIFLQTSCPCSNSHIEHLRELATKYPKITFLGVHADGYTDSLQAYQYFKERKLPFQIVDDGEFMWTIAFKAMKTPQTFLVSPKGEIVYEGAITNSANFASAKEFYLKEILEAVTAKKEIPYQHKRSLGCYITRVKKL